MQRHGYRVKIVRGGEEFEAEGDKAFVLAMLKRFQSGALPSPAGSEETAGSSARLRSSLEKPSAAKPLAVGEFIRQLSPKKHTDIVVAFGYYLEKQGGAKDFTAADINRCYYEAKLEPSNTSQMISQNIKRGTIMEPKKGRGVGKRRYMLTQAGEDRIKALVAKVK